MSSSWSARFTPLNPFAWLTIASHAAPDVGRDMSRSRLMRIEPMAPDPDGFPATGTGVGAGVAGAGVAAAGAAGTGVGAEVGTAVGVGAAVGTAVAEGVSRAGSGPAGSGSSPAVPGATTEMRVDASAMRRQADDSEVWIRPRSTLITARV